MKKTYTINLNGQVFSIDEDAYAQLRDYIETLEKHYLPKEGGKEIMADIESRIAELFQNYLLESNRKVISQPDITRVVEIMGTPDVIIDEDFEPTSFSSSKKQRKLYRDPDEAILGGVAAGLGAYFSISASWVRVFFIILAFLYGITFLVYIILWIVLPKAITSNQKLEMKGENINISNIEKNIRTTYNEVKKNSIVQQAGNRFARFFSCLGEILRKIFSAIGHILITLILLGSTFCFFMVNWSIIFSFHILPEHHYLLLKYLSAPVPVWFLQIITYGFLAIPLFLIMYYSMSYLFKFQSRKKILAIAGCIWIFCASLVFIFGCYYALSNTLSFQEKIETVKIPADTTRKVIHIHFNNSCPENYDLISTGLDYYMRYTPQIKDTLFLHPFISFQKTDKSAPELTIRKKAQGISQETALQNLNNIRYKYSIRQDTLYLNDYFTLAKSQIQGNDLRINLYIPDSYRINLCNPLPQQFISKNFPEKRISGSPRCQSFRMLDGQLKKISE